MYKYLAAIAAAISLLFALANAQAGTLIGVPPYPGSMATYVQNISDNNLIAGEYVDEGGNGHAFFGTLDGQYTSFDAGLSVYTRANGINSKGWITGIFFDNDTCPIFYCTFVRKPTGEIVVPNIDGDPIQGYVQQITNAGVFVGSFKTATGQWNSFLGKGDQYKHDIKIKLPSAQARGINAAGVVVGFYANANGGISGFVLQNGKAVSVDYPDQTAVQTVLSGINDKGLATGYWNTGNPAYITRGFTYDIATKSFRAFKLKGENDYTYLFGINNAGLIAVQSDAGNFIYCPLKKKDCPSGGTERASFGPRIVAVDRSRIAHTHQNSFRLDKGVFAIEHWPVRR